MTRIRFNGSRAHPPLSRSNAAPRDLIFVIGLIARDGKRRGPALVWTFILGAAAAAPAKEIAMRRILVLAGVAALSVSVLSVATPALAQASDPAAKTPAPACFRVSRIQNHTKGDAKTLYLRVGPQKQVFRVGVSGTCLAGVNSSDPLVLETAGGSDRVCRPLDLDLKIRIGPGGLTPCIIKDIARLSPEQVAALPPKLRP